MFYQAKENNAVVIENIEPQFRQLFGDEYVNRSEIQFSHQWHEFSVLEKLLPVKVFQANCKVYTYKDTICIENEKGVSTFVEGLEPVIIYLNVYHERTFIGMLVECISASTASNLLQPIFDGINQDLELIGIIIKVKQNNLN